MELTQSREYSQFGQPLPIPLSEYVAYCELFGIKELSEREAMFRHVRAMDTIFVEKVGERLKQETDKGAKS